MAQTVNPRFKLICYEMRTYKTFTWCVMFRTTQSTLLGLRSPEDGSTTSRRIAGNYLPVYMSLQLHRLYCLTCRIF